MQTSATSTIKQDIDAGYLFYDFTILKMSRLERRHKVLFEPEPTNVLIW